jgi:capsular polysaccharide biosynthesis protein/Mrp family chromosome partitioning ATPase
MASPSRPVAPELGDYLSVLRRRWRIVLFFAGLGTLAAVTFVTVAPKDYLATASVFVNANAATANQAIGGRTGGIAVNMDNEAQIVKSDSVSQPAAKALHSRKLPAQLTQQVTVNVPANTTVLQISCSSGSASWAATCAQAFAKAYLATREGQARNKVLFEIRQLQAREGPLLEKAIQLRAQARAAGRRVSRQRISDEIKSNNAQLAALRLDISTLGGSVNYNPGYVLTPAIPPTAPSSPKTLLDLAGGLFAGLLLGLLLAFLADRRDDRVHQPRDLERFLDLPVMLAMPERGFKGASPLMLPSSKAGQAFTELSEAVAAGLGDGNHVLVVAASSRGQGCTVVAANLAVALARTRADVLLACAYYDDAITPGLMGITHGRGMAELLSGSATVSEVARRAGGAGRLKIIPPAANTGALVNDLEYDERQRLVGQMRAAARYVIIAVQGEGDDADAFSLAEFADAAVVVTTIGRTLKTDTAHCVRRLDRMRTPVLGAAVLPSPRWDRVQGRPAAMSVAGSGRDARSKRPVVPEVAPPGVVGEAPHSPALDLPPSDEAAPSPVAPAPREMHG